MSNLINAQDVILNNINVLCKKFGLNNIMTQLYVIMYFSDKPLSLNDMVDRLKISKGSASINIRALERYGVVRSVWVKGSRKDYYEAETDIFKVVTDRIRSMTVGRLNDLENMVNSAYKELDFIIAENGDDKKSAEAFRGKLEKIKDLYDRINGMFQLFDKFIDSNRAGRAEPVNSKMVEEAGAGV